MMLSGFSDTVVARSRVLPVVVDFWAEWCRPCLALSPILEALAAEAEGGWELVKIDLEAHPELARDLGLSSIPAVKMFRDGKVVAEFIGLRPAAEIRRWLDANLRPLGPSG